MRHKILPLSTLQQLTEQWHTQNCRIVFTNGCFDLLHVGHVRYLQKARQQGDLLIIGINSDASVQALKGPTRPLNNELARAEVLAALSCVDYVTVFSERTADNLLTLLRPSVYVKAGDYTLETLPEADCVTRLGIETVFVPFEAGFSTTSLVNRMNEKG